MVWFSLFLLLPIELFSLLLFLLVLGEFKVSLLLFLVVPAGELTDGQGVACIPRVSTHSPPFTKAFRNRQKSTFYLVDVECIG